MLRKSFLELCCDRVFYVATEFGQDQGFSCRDREFDVVIEFPEIASRHSIPYVTIKCSKT